MSPFITPPDDNVPPTQKALVLRATKERYLLQDYPIPPLLNDDEVLVRVHSIALNPIDWKAPDFGFGIPELPYVAGRELAGEVVGSRCEDPRIQHGDKVIVISTDYRDLRKAAYQEYVVATTFNVARLPPNITLDQGSAVGVAFVTTALALGISAGLDFSSIAQGPDLLHTVRRQQPSQLPEDVRQECLHGIPDHERARKGDWIAIWGGSSTCAYIANQLAHLAGLRTIIVLDAQKHGHTLASSRPELRADVVVDNHDPQRAIEVIRAVTQGELRFAIDCVGRTSAEHLLRSLQQESAGKEEVDGTVDEPTPPSTPPSEPASRLASHLIGLTGLPKLKTGGVRYHSVPVKLFHEVKEVGEEVVVWLERLLARGLLVPPRILGTLEGLESVNDGLDRMRRRMISGGRLVARVLS